ncbi:hypothetical protein, partial [Streptomyces sp. NPDC047981]|uniref:hypothetical protein n=1 Tax=Streptomyces sp. NPDC047981 TaxID=3154610 RepID=UPI003447A91A
MDITDALTQASEGRWADAAALAGRLTGLNVDEPLLRGAVLRVAARWNVPESTDEEYAGTLLTFGVTTADHYWEFLYNPFAAGGGPQIPAGRDQDLACLDAIGKSDWNAAQSWAAWGSGGPATANQDTLTHAVYLTAQRHSVNSAGASVPQLAAFLMTCITPDDFQVLETWKNTLVSLTQTPAADPGPPGPGVPNPAWNTTAQDVAGGVDAAAWVDGAGPPGPGVPNPAWNTTAQDVA